MNDEKHLNDLDNLYKLYGICAHHCSNIEYGTAFLLHPIKWNKHRMHLDRKKQEMHNKLQLGDIAGWNASNKRFDEALENVQFDISKLDELPLGKLMTQIKDNYSITEEQEKYLMEVLSKRIYIIHSFWGNYGKRMENVKVIKEMIEELRNSEAFLRAASNWLRNQAFTLNGVKEILNSKEDDSSP